MRFTIIFPLFLLSFMSLVISIDWQQWLTQPGSTSQGVLTLTAGVSLYSPYMVERVYGNCWRNQNGGRVYIFSFQCAKAVSRAIAEICVGLKGLGYATGWYKRDGASLDDSGIRDFFGKSAVYVNVDEQMYRTSSKDYEYYDLGSSMKIVDVSGIPIAINVSDDTPYDSSKIWVTGLNLGSKDGSELNKREETMSDILAVYRRTKHGGIAITPLSPLKINATKSGAEKRDFDVGEGFYTEGGTVLLECQYGLGADADSSYRWGAYYQTMINDAGEGHTLHWRMTALHGYIGSTSRLKCATKIYDETQSDDSWRSWDDVWSSF